MKFRITLQKISYISTISSKLDCIRFALSLQDHLIINYENNKEKPYNSIDGNSRHYVCANHRTDKVWIAAREIP